MDEGLGEQVVWHASSAVSLFVTGRATSTAEVAGTINLGGSVVDNDKT